MNWMHMGNRTTNRVVRAAITLVATVLVASVAVAPPLARGQQPAPPEPQTEPVADDHLPWQPGLGQPVTPPAAAPLPNNGHPPGAPATAPALPSARPIPPLPSGPPQSFTRDQSVLPIPATREGFGDPAAAGDRISGGLTGPYPVVPTVMVQDEEPVADGQAGEADGNLIDSRITTVTRGVESLPNDAGQVWRTYDISPYTYRVENTTRPQQAIIDWIIKETGSDMWFSEPLGILSASRNELHVYHTPEIQNRIKPIVDRFVYTHAAPQVIGLRLATIASPNWRTLALTMMQPVPIEAPGIEAWLMSKENAAILTGQLRLRADYQEHNNGDIVVTDGQKYILSRTRPVEFLRSLAWVNQGAGYYQPVTDRVDEGYTVELSAEFAGRSNHRGDYRMQDRPDRTVTAGFGATARTGGPDPDGTTANPPNGLVASQ